MAHQESLNCDASDGTGCQSPHAVSSCTNCGFLGFSSSLNLCSNCCHELVLNQGNRSPLHFICREHLQSFKEPLLFADLAVTSTSRAENNEETLSSQSKHREASLLTQISSARDAEATSSADVSSLGQVYVRTSLSAQILPQRDALVSPLGQKGDPVTLSVDPVFSSGLGAILPGRRQTGNRCHVCHKRVALLGFKCRCGHLLCATHRYSDKHDCTFNYKAAAREAIAKANPVVKAERVVRL